MSSKTAIDFHHYYGNPILMGDGQTFTMERRGDELFFSIGDVLVMKSHASIRLDLSVMEMRGLDDAPPSEGSPDA